MWDRATLKQNAKNSFNRSYWPSVLVGLILGLLAGDISFSYLFNYNDYGNNYSDIGDSFYSTYNNFFTSNVSALLTVIGIVAFSSAIISIILNIFVFNPLIVGCNRWFIISRTNNNTPIGEICHCFKEGFGNVIKIEFLRYLFIALWSLLFIIPGIIKSYEYRMIPYLLAENPNMSQEEAFMRSRQMMTGNKFDTFVLDLSFIGWFFVGAMTFNLATVFYVAPYRAYTNMELYVALCSLNNNSNNSQADQYTDYRQYNNDNDNPNNKDTW